MRLPDSAANDYHQISCYSKRLCTGCVEGDQGEKGGGSLPVHDRDHGTAMYDPFLRTRQVSPSLSGTSSGSKGHITDHLRPHPCLEKGKYVVIPRHWRSIKNRLTFSFQNRNRHIQKCITREKKKVYPESPTPTSKIPFVASSRDTSRYMSLLLGPKPPCLTTWLGKKCSPGCTVGSPAWPPILSVGMQKEIDDADFPTCHGVNDQ